MKTCTQLIRKLCGKWPLRQPPMIPSSWYLLPSEMWNSLLFPGETILLFLISRIQHRMSLLRCNYKKTMASVFSILSLSLSVFFFAWTGGVQLPHHKAALWESHMVQNPELLTTKGVGLDANISQANLQMRAQPQTTASTTTTTFWEIFKQRHPPELHPCSWPTETVSIKCLLFQVSKFWGNMLNRHRQLIQTLNRNFRKAVPGIMNEFWNKKSIVIYSALTRILDPDSYEFISHVLPLLACIYTGKLFNLTVPQSGSENGENNTT